MSRLTRTLLLVWLTLTALTFSGCAPAFSRVSWSCESGPCGDQQRAFDKCRAQANTALDDRQRKWTITNQCMAGEGFEIQTCRTGDDGIEQCMIVPPQHRWMIRSDSVRASDLVVR
jgi:hypothetical protein